MLDLMVLKYLAEECERQQSGEASVYHMGAAYELCQFQSSSFPLFTVSFIEDLGCIVEPKKNQMGFRKGPALFCYTHEAVHHALIKDKLRDLCRSQHDLTPEEFYKEFEEIHPFVDGNGRVGSLLYNLKRGTLTYPSAPPIMF